MVVEAKARRAGQALMSEVTRFETPLIQRDASARWHVNDASRDRHAPVRAARGVSAVVRLRFCGMLRLRTVYGLRPHANFSFGGCAEDSFYAWQHAS